ncbi:MAG: hypothetical protein WDM86_15640 [Rhizomicrobium sp.]
MRIGVDFDNTIVSYDGVFHRIAVENGLIPPHIESSKDSVRNYLRKVGREDEWTALQGHVYGARMDAAQPYPGVREFFRHAVAQGISIAIVSHKTRHPFLGEKHDLHLSARRWLEAQGFFDPAQIGLDESHVFFEMTKEDKMARIGALGRTVFIDDLPEFLGEPAFPGNVERLLFDPKGENAHVTQFTRMRSWAEIAARHFPASAEAVGR